MPYTIRASCPRCGRAYTYTSPCGSDPVFDECPLCWKQSALTEEEAAIENDKDDS